MSKYKESAVVAVGGTYFLMSVEDSVEVARALSRSEQIIMDWSADLYRMRKPEERPVDISVKILTAGQLAMLRMNDE